MANLNQKETYVYDFVRLRPEEQIGLHAQPTWELSLIVKGHGLRVMGNRQDRFEAGEVVLVPPEIPHCWYFDRNAENELIENVCVHISEDWLRSLAEILPETASAIIHILEIETAVKFSPPSAVAISALMMAMKDETELERLSSLLRIFALIQGEKDAENIGQRIAIDRNEERRRNVEIYVACNLQRDLTLASVARHVGLSRTAFCRWMRQHMHTTFAAYVLSLRLQRATALLRETPATPISQIAYQSGFSDISHFNRMFKREFGLSPREFREWGK